MEKPLTHNPGKELAVDKWTCHVKVSRWFTASKGWEVKKE